MRPGWLLFAAGIVLYMTLPAALLSLWGVPYDSPGGSVLVKFHAGTYVLAVATLLLCAGGGNPLRGLAGALVEERWLSLHILSTALLLAYSIFRYGSSGSAFVIESLMMAPICALGVTRMDAAERRRLFRLIMVLIAANAALAIGESLLHLRLVPYTVSGGVAIKDLYFRSTALQGHPLENAILTAVLALLALELRIGWMARLGLMALLMLALLAFGSRTGFALTLAALASAMVLVAGRGLLAGRYSYRAIMGAGALAMLLLALGIGGAAALGLGERIFGQALWDDSAQVRLHIWSVFAYLRPEDLVFGIAPAEIEDLIYRLGLNYPQETIENFWLLMLMQFGAIGMVPFVGGLAAGMIHLWRLSGLPGRLALAVFLAIASTNNSLAAKCHSLVLLYAAVAASQRAVRANGMVQVRNNDMTHAPLPI